MADLRQHILSASPKVGNVCFIAIDGHGGSGKSTLAELLSKQLDAEIIHTDDFAGWDNPENWWPLIIKRVFEPIKKGEETLSYPRSKWWETHEPVPVANQPVTKIMILEGVSSLRKEFREYLSFGIFVETPRNICLQRGFERDKGQDDKSDEEIKRMWQKWYEKEEAYFAKDSPQEFADLVVRGDSSFDEQISK